MHAYCRAALAVLFPFTLVGCAGLTPTQNMAPNVAKAVQPVDVTVGIKQPELYADWEISRAGQAAAVSCGSIPGLGILLAGVCGGVAGAMDATVNSERAKAADETIRPLKDQIVDVQFDTMMKDAVTKALKDVASISLSGVVVTKTVDDKAYEEAFRASKANGVMFVNVDYHISKDFSELEVSVRGLLYPRSEAARTTAGLPAALPSANGAALVLQNSAYRADVFYHFKLPVKSAESAALVATWSADNARLLRTGLQNGTTAVARFLAEDLQRAPGAPLPALSKAEAAPGITADLIAERDGGKLFRYANGSVHFHTVATLPTATSTAAVSAGAAAQ